MKLKEAQLLGILAVVAVGIIVLCMWGGGRHKDDLATVLPEPGVQNAQLDRSEDLLRAAPGAPAKQDSAVGAPATVQIGGPGIPGRPEDHKRKLSTDLENKAGPEIPLAPKESGPPVAPAVGDAAPLVHVVQKGDTLAGISRKYYKTENKWQLILNANRSIVKDPKKLPLNAKLVIPPDESAAPSGSAAVAAGTAAAPAGESAPAAAGDAQLLSATAPAPAAEKFYVVQRGDSIWLIARKFYKNDPDAVSKIQEANKDLVKDAKALKVGTRLVLP